MIHNVWFNTTTGEKKAYYQTLHVGEWWDNGTLPIWITAQRQVRAPSLPVTGADGSSWLPEKGIWCRGVRTQPGSGYRRAS